MLSIWISVLTFVLSLQISPGTDLAALPLGVISGHITQRGTDELLKDIAVVLLQKRFNEDGVEETNLLASQSTNEKGEYRFILPIPGRFKIGVDTPAMNGNIYLPELYASDIDLQPPQKVNIDLALDRGAPVTVRGHLIDGTGHRFQHLDWVWLTNSRYGTAAPGEAHGGSHYHNSSTFEIPLVLPGFYYLCGYRFDDLSHRADSVVPIVVRDSDLDVDLVSEESYPLGGRLRFSGTPPSFKEIRIGARLLDDPLPGVDDSHASVLPNGFFTLREVVSGTYRLSILNVPSPFYVKSARIDGVDVLEKGIKVPGASKVAKFIDVMLGGDGGQISGSVVRATAKAAGGSAVVLIPESHGLLRSDLYKRVVADAAGQFSIAGIAPGEYRIYAWKGLYGYDYFDPAFLKPFEGSGLRVQVTSGGLVKLQLQEHDARTP
jgi:hypothetical protein